MPRRILIAAYACEPHSGSEPAVGWNWAVQAARTGNEVHVITRANNKQAIEAELRKRPVPGLSFHYLDLGRPMLWLKKRTGTLGLVSYYYLWQLALYRRARRLHSRHKFDLAHHVTFANDWLPSGLAMTDIPFVWGPIGGSGHTVPKGFESSWSAQQRGYEALRRSLQWIFLRFDPLLRITRKKALTALPYTEEAAAVLPGSLSERSQVVTHIGVDPESEAVRTGITSEGIQIATGGRLVHWKGFDLLIEGLALHHFPGSKITVIITGDGPARDDLEQLVADRGLERVVEFTGRLPALADIRRILTDCDIYALLTLRDGPPVGILEAMHAGLPILYLDLGAPAELVPPGAGIGIPVGSRQETISQVAEALSQIESDPTRLPRMGDVARRHALDVHSWQVIGDQIAAIYDSLDGG